jgi:hypothetical protein
MFGFVDNFSQQLFRRFFTALFVFLFMQHKVCPRSTKVCFLEGVGGGGGDVEEVSPSTACRCQKVKKNLTSLTGSPEVLMVVRTFTK